MKKFQFLIMSSIVALSYCFVLSANHTVEHVFGLVLADNQEDTQMPDTEEGSDTPAKKAMKGSAPAGTDSSADNQEASSDPDQNAGSEEDTDNEED